MKSYHVHLVSKSLPSVFLAYIRKYITLGWFQIYIEYNSTDVKYRTKIFEFEVKIVELIKKSGTRRRKIYLTPVKVSRKAIFGLDFSAYAYRPWDVPYLAEGDTHICDPLYFLPILLKDI